MRSRRRRPLLWALLCLAPFSLGNGCQGTPPAELTIDFPPDGYFTNASGISVTGTARRGGGPITSLRVNGVSVLPLSPDPQDGSWSIEVPLDPARVFNRIFVQMFLEGGTRYRRSVTVVSGDGVDTGFVADGAFSDDGVLLRLNDSGLDEVEPLMSSRVNVDLAALLPPGTW